MVKAPEERVVWRVRLIAGGAVLLSLANLAVATVSPEPLRYASFPIGPGPSARAIVGSLSIATAVLGIRLLARRLGAWLTLVSLLAWATVGLVVVPGPLAPSRALPPAVLLVVLFAHHRVLTARSPWAAAGRRAGAIEFVAFVVVVNVLAARALGGHFRPPIRTWTDSVYYVTITFTTVGYGDIVPVTEVGRAAAVLIVLFTFSAFALAAGLLVPPLFRSASKGVAAVMQRAQSKSLKDHVIVAGSSPEAHAAVRALQKREVDFVLVHDSPDFIESFERVDFATVRGPPTSEDTLERANLRAARALVAAHDDDAVNAFIVLTAREMAPDVRIVAMATDVKNARKLTLAGADAVVSPPVVGGTLLGHAALDERPQPEDLLEGEFEGRREEGG